MSRPEAVPPATSSEADDQVSNRPPLVSGVPSREGGTSGRAVQRNDQRRHPRLGAGLGAVRAAQGAAGRRERPLHRARRRRLLGHELLRRADRDSEHRPDRAAWRSVHAVPHHGALLADSLVPAERPQPHPQQHGLHHGGGDRIPERERDDPAGERIAVGDPRRAGLEHVHGRQVAPLPDRRDAPRLDAPQLADRPRLRALVRVPRRGDEPVVSRPRLRQPPRSPAEDACRGLPLQRGHHRQGDRVHPGRQGDRAGEAVLPLLRAGRLPCPAPRAEGVDRQVQGPLRHGLRGAARANAGEPEETRPRPGEHRSAADQPDRHPGHAHRTGRQAVPDDGLHAAVGLARRRREAAVRALRRGVRRLPRARRPPDRTAARLPRGRRSSSTTP